MTERLDQLEKEYGLEALGAAETFASDLYMLTFQENRRGGDPVAHTPDGKAVFPDKFRGGDDIMPGDSWLCAVTAKGGSTFFAAPLKRVDAAFLFDLAADQVERIAEVALRDHQAAIAPLLESALGKQVDPATKGRLVALQEQKDNLEDRLKDLEELYDDAVQRLQRFEAEVQTLRAADANDQEAERPTSRANGAWPTVGAGTVPETGPARVERIGEEVLVSQAFTADRYYGHISPDRRRLFVKPHMNGNLPCVNGRLHIPGFARVVAFGGRQAFVAHYEPRHGGWFVRL